MKSSKLIIILHTLLLIILNNTLYSITVPTLGKWPIENFTSTTQHALNATMGEYRTTGTDHFHAGIDIDGDEGTDVFHNRENTYVVNVSAASVSICEFYVISGTTWDDARDGIGDDWCTFRYVHVKNKNVQYQDNIVDNTSLSGRSYNSTTGFWEYPMHLLIAEIDDYDDPNSTSDDHLHFELVIRDGNEYNMYWYYNPLFYLEYFRDEESDRNPELLDKEVYINGTSTEITTGDGSSSNPFEIPIGTEIDLLIKAKDKQSNNGSNNVAPFAIYSAMYDEQDNDLEIYNGIDFSLIGPIDNDVGAIATRGFGLVYDSNKSDNSNYWFWMTNTYNPYSSIPGSNTYIDFSSSNFTVENKYYAKVTIMEVIKSTYSSTDGLVIHADGTEYKIWFEITSGSGPGGPEDDIYFSSAPTEISENTQVTYTSIFDDADYGGSYADYWNWQMEFYHDYGAYTLHSADSIYGVDECDWVLNVGSLPFGYNWLRDSSGKIKGKVTVNTTDSDDYQHIRSIDILMTQPYASPPYTTGFEAGFLDQYWTSSSTENGQVLVTSNYYPRTSDKHVTLDVSSNGVYSLNELMLHCALSSSSEDVSLEFYWKDFGDENHSQDGIYFSDNGGSSYEKVYNLTPQSYSNNYWRKFTLDVDALATNNSLDLTENFIIKFQQYDNYKISSDGFAFDDLVLTATNPLPKIAIEQQAENEEINSELPDKFEIYQNYPNPFNPTTTISYALKNELDVKLIIYDISGKEVVTLVNRKETPGYKSVVWAGRDSRGRQVSSGIYIYRIVSREFVKARKMVFSK